ncbi:MAG: hypothetical protein WBB07_20660 [Mycobacterium sp.]
MPELFVLGTGQEDNIGDVVLRREYFDRLRKVGRLHIYLGDSSADFLESLDLHQEDVIYSNLRQWHRAAWRALFQGKVWFVDKPGELGLDDRTLRRQIKLLPLVLGTRLRGGQVLRLGMAMRAMNPVYFKYLRLLFRLSTEVRWRDSTTKTAFLFGSVSPDWAFGWPPSGTQLVDNDRPLIAVTYREDRDSPSDTLLESLRALAHASSRRLVVVTQVRRDGVRSAELATRLNAELIPWPADRTLLDHENVLREIYQNSVLVVSDRLHALIVGMTEGAVPLCVTDRAETKIGRHFDAVGFPRSTVSLEVIPNSLDTIFEEQMARCAEAQTVTQAAWNDLNDLTAHLELLATNKR